MKAIDTNILARALVRDDRRQAAIADVLLREGVFIPLTVLLETAWLLESRYKIGRAAVADTLSDVLDLPGVTVDQGEALHWAIARYREGGDIADAIHLVGSLPADCFVTFDRAMQRQMTDPPMMIEVLK